MGVIGKVIAATAAEAAEQLANQDPVTPPDPARWIKRALALAILLLGWLFILWTNRFHLTAPTIFVCIGFLAIELAIYNLFRTGAQVVAPEDESDSTWGRPLGAKGELEREKKTLLKAIKEAEFDREMGKLSKVDADEMIGLYRARAIEVIKELDKLGGAAGTVREQIEREVKARLELEARTRKPVEKAVEKAADKKKTKTKKTPTKAAEDAAKAAEAAAAAAKAAAAAATAAASPDSDGDAAAAADAAADAASVAAAEATEAAEEATEAVAEAKVAAAEAAPMAAAESSDGPAKEATT